MQKTEKKLFVPILTYIGRKHEQNILKKTVVWRHSVSIFLGENLEPIVYEGEAGRKEVISFGPLKFQMCQHIKKRRTCQGDAADG